MPFQPYQYLIGFRLQANIAADEMALTFNCGIGMLIYVADDKVEAALKLLAENGAGDAVPAGKLVARGDGDFCALIGA